MPRRSEKSKEQEAYTKMKELLWSRRLIPGQKIVLRDLEEELGMSKTPIISCLARLEQENLVVSLRNRGYYIRELTPTEIMQMFELKEKLQDIVIEYAVKGQRQKDLSRLEKALNNYLTYEGQVYDLTRFRLDTEFHEEIAKLSGNDFLVSVLNQQYQIISTAADLTILTPLINQFKKEHLLLFQAIKGGEKRRAKKLLRAHDRAGAKALAKGIKTSRLGKKNP
jgi:DNA-binding GntR family transcriptional regulator